MTDKDIFASMRQLAKKQAASDKTMPVPSSTGTGSARRIEDVLKAGQPPAAKPVPPDVDKAGKP